MARKPRRPWVAVFVLTLLYAVAYLDRQLISLTSEAIRLDLGISDFRIGLLQGFGFALFYGMFGIPLGYAIDRWDRRWIVFLGVATWGAATVACGLAQNYDQLLLARMCVGAGEAVIGPAAYVIMAEQFYRQKLTLPMSVYSIGALIGAELSIALCGYLLHLIADGVRIPLVADLHSWRQIFIVIGAPGILFALLAFLLPGRRDQAGAAENPIAKWSEVFLFMRDRWQFFVCHFIGFSCILAAAVGRQYWLPAFFQRRFGMEIGDVAFLIATFSTVTGIVAFIVGGRLVDGMVRKGSADAHFKYYSRASLIIAVCGCAAFAMPTVPAVLALLAPVALPVAMAGIAASAIQVVTPASMRGRVSGIYLMVVSLVAQTGGPLLVATITQYGFADTARLPAALSISMFCLGGVAAAVFALGRPAQRRATLLAEQADPAASLP